MIMCIQCAMEALVKGEPYVPTSENETAHMQRVHPDLAATKARRIELEQILAERVRTGKALVAEAERNLSDDQA